jgi:hypothetical protein
MEAAVVEETGGGAGGGVRWWRADRREQSRRRGGGQRGRCRLEAKVVAIVGDRRRQLEIEEAREED